MSVKPVPLMTRHDLQGIKNPLLKRARTFTEKREEIPRPLVLNPSIRHPYFRNP